MNKIIIFKEKHANRYFDASTPELIHAACLYILKERMESGFYYICENEPEIPDLLKDQTEILSKCGKTDSDSDSDLYFKKFIDIFIQSLPEFSRELAYRILTNYNAELYFYFKEINFYKKAKQAIKEENGKLAEDLLYSRADYEYETLQIEFIETV